MNKTLLLVICDFLLLSMLALARFDPPEDAPEPTLSPTASSATAEAELIGLLEESLQAELASRENLTEDLTDTRESLQAQAQLLAEREAALKAKVAEAEALEQTKAEIEAEQKNLLTKFESTQSKLNEISQERSLLNQSLNELEKEASETKTRLSQTEESLVSRELALAEREAALQAALEEKEALAADSESLKRDLEVAKAERALLEKNLAEQQVDKARIQAEKEAAFARAERLSENVSQLGQGVSQIGEGVSTLKQTSEAIQKEMDASRPRTMSEIFTRFQKNRATLTFTSTEKGLFGNTQNKRYSSQSILVKDTQGDVYLVTHSSSTPFAFNKNPQNLLAARLTIQVGSQAYEVPRIAFLNTDPRILYIPLPTAVVQASGLETFPLALQPERWEEAILVKNDESNFGRTEFRRLTSSDRFLKMNRPALGEIFAEFASSRGDLAFTKNAQFIGLLSDTTHAVVLDNFLASGILNLGDSFSTQTTTETVNRLEDRIRKLPAEVQ